MSTLQPALLCLNLQCAYVDPSDPRYSPRGLLAVAQAQACLGWARRQGLPVMHVHTWERSGASSTPIPGCWPLPTETVIVNSGRFIFDGLSRRAGGAPRDAFVLGFTGARDCVTVAVEAQRTGARLIFVTDAIASPPLTAHDSEVVDEVLIELLGQWGAKVTTADLLRRDTRHALEKTGG